MGRRPSKPNAVPETLDALSNDELIDMVCDLLSAQPYDHNDRCQHCSADCAAEHAEGCVYAEAVRLRSGYYRG